MGAMLTANRSMGRKTEHVRLGEDTVEALYQLKGRKESYDDVVQVLIAQYHRTASEDDPQIRLSDLIEQHADENRAEV